MQTIGWVFVLINAAVYKFIPVLLYVIFTVLVGKVIFNKSRPIARYAFVFVILLTPILLAVNGHRAFKEACKTAKIEDFSGDPIQSVEGYFRKAATPPADNYIGMVSYELLTSGTYKYIEQGNETAGYAQYRINDGHYEGSKILVRQSKYDFEITSPESVSPLYSPYFTTSKVRIVRASDGQIISQATEFLYGGGLLGKYQGCGYVDVGIHQFRPIDGSSKSLGEIYKARDREFIQKILVPKRPHASD